MGLVKVVPFSLTMTFMWSYLAAITENKSIRPTTQRIPIIGNIKGEFSPSNGIGLLNIILKKYQNTEKNSEKRLTSPVYDSKDFGQRQTRENENERDSEESNRKSGNFNEKSINARHFVRDDKIDLMQNNYGNDDGNIYGTSKKPEKSRSPMQRNVPSTVIDDGISGSYKEKTSGRNSNDENLWKNNARLPEWNNFEGNRGKINFWDFEGYNNGWNNFNGRTYGKRGSRKMFRPLWDWKKWNENDRRGYGNVWDGIDGGGIIGSEWTDLNNYRNRWNRYDESGFRNYWPSTSGEGGFGNAWNNFGGFGNIWKSFVGNGLGRKGVPSLFGGWNKFGKGGGYGGWNVFDRDSGWNRFGKGGNYAGWNMFSC